MKARWKELDDLVSLYNIDDRALGDAKGHLKTESLLKNPPIKNWHDSMARMIVAHKYSTAALFAPIFN